MKAYLWFALKRAVQLIVVIFFGVSAAFLITSLSPINPVEQVLGRITARSNFSPDAIEAMRSALTDLYGVDAPIMQQYINFWRRVVVGDLGPSLIAFPTPAMNLVMRALPWTVGLLSTSILITWLLGNTLGGLAGYFQNNRLLKVFGVVAMGVQPIPYYIVAFILLILFGFVWPILPISGGFAMNVRPGWTLPFVLSILQHAILPATSLVIVGFGTWFLGMRALVSNIVTEDYVTYAELAGVKRERIVFSYVIRNAAVPQLTALAMTLGAIFSGTIITEQVYNYPGLGTLLVDAVNAGDSTTVLAVSVVAITAVAAAIFIVDLLHPVLDPRVRTE
ncbi:ABC transporter permease [Pelagibacterium halotolerans]|uniref:ABC transporter permease n=1 Tax=Pelagibacterium halotolerans TaxID=531813 RepID=UPI003850E47A